MDAKTKFSRQLIVRTLLIPILMVIFGVIGVDKIFAEETRPAGPQMEAADEERYNVQKFGLIAAAGAFGFGAVGAGIAIASVGSSAMGAIGEKPEIAGQALIFIALAEGLAVFGFIVAILILGKV